MIPSSSGQLEAVISSGNISPSHESPAVTLQKTRSSADPTGVSAPQKAHSSTPDLWQVIVDPREEGNLRRNTLFRTQSRVGRVRSQRSQTGRQHVTEKEDDSLPHTVCSLKEPKPSTPTPSLRSQPSAHPAKSRVDILHPRIRRLRPHHLAESKNKRHTLNPYIRSSKPSTGAPPDGPIKSLPTTRRRIPGPNKDSEPLENLKRPKPSFDEVAPFWESYNKMADFEDKDFVQALGVSVDSLSTLAGLFSAVNTTFIIGALQRLQPDQAERTNDLIRSLILTFRNSTPTDNPLRIDPFNPTPRALRSTALFFVSLLFSLTAAFGAVMGKEWRDNYEREGGLKPLPARGRERQKKYEARDQWRMESVIGILPTLLQISLLLFLIALVDFVLSINSCLGRLVMAFSLVPAVFYVATTTIAVIYPISPFQTRLSFSIRHLCFWTKVHVDGLRDWAVNGIKLMSNFVSNKLYELRPPLAHICTIFPAFMLRLAYYLFLALSFLSRPLFWLRRHIPHDVHFLTRKATASSPTKVHTSASQHLSNPDDVANIECLSTYIQRASIPQDLTTVLAALESLPIDQLISADQSLVKSLVEASIKRVLNPWYHHARASKQASNTTFDMLQLLGILHTAYTSFGYGGECLLLSDDADDWIMQELFSALSRGPLDVISASMAAEVISLSGRKLACSGANLEALVQNLERSSKQPRHYLPYLTLLLAPTRLDQTINQSQTKRILPALASSMWVDDEADMDFKNGDLRLWALPARLGNGSDKYRFSKFLLSWREGGDSEDRELRDEAYLRSATKLLTTHPTSLFWPEQLENDGHIPVLLGIMKSRRSYAPSFQALYAFLTLWYRRCIIAPSGVSQLYLDQGAVETVLFVWEGHYYNSDNSNYAPGVMNHTVSYLEEAKCLELLESENLAEFVRQYERVGGRYMQGDKRLPSLCERIDALVTDPPITYHRQVQKALE